MNKVNLIGKIIMYAFVAISVLLLGAIIMNQEAAEDALALADGSWTGNIITWTIAMFVIGVVLIILSYFFGWVIDPSRIVKDLIMLVGFAALIFICWSMSDSTPMNLPGYEGSENQAPWLNIADVGLYLLYIFTAVAVFAIVASEIYQLFK
ncbi:MAG: hypothetical protein J6Y72_02300 [Bacteroidales bacterium]|jgi:phosphoglycerol transferase MdoB-like AlkP superfamily enzyme|nr:hypothetical protein [Bacteroidales bacterium]MBP5418632.1 hypothetical protein [Bacteroidales bacterium]